MTTKKKTTEEYSADQIVSLSPIAHIRKRPNLSLGTFTVMKLTALREVADNAMDEHRAGYGKKIRVIIHEDGSAEVQDSGRGVPTGINSKTGENGIYMAFGKVGSGGKFGAADSGYGGTASLGLNGVGTTATNATSSRFDTIVYRDGKKHRLSFKEGEPGHWDADNGPQDKFTPLNEIKVSKDDRPVAERKERPTGTTIRFWPDPTIFGPEATFRIHELRESLRSTAFLMPGICIELDDRLGQKGSTSDENPLPEVAPQHDIYEFDGGISEMLDLIAPDEKIHDTIAFHTEGSFKEKVPVPQPDGTVKNEEVERKVGIDVAMRWGKQYEYTLRSFANTIHTHLHGTHVTGMERALNKVLIDSIKNTRGMLKAKDEPPVAADVQEGLTIILSITQSELNFVGQEKSRLGGVNTQKVVNAEVAEWMNAWIANKKNAATLKIIQQKIVEATRVRLAQRQQKEVERRKTALQSASMPAKLVDCSEVGTEHTELLIAEGDSALGTLKAARDSRYQALLPIRGKILNAQKASSADILKNAEISAILQVIGAGSGRTFDLEKIRVSRVIIAADADIDGAHIACLLITMFAKLARPMIEDGRLYAAVPPLYTLKTKGKNAQVHYLEDEAAKNKLLAELDKKKISYEPLSRLKGLGEMDAKEFWDTTLNPETRTLRQIRFEDVAAAEAMLDLAMGNDVAPRKEWILNSRGMVSDEELDLIG